MTLWLQRQEAIDVHSAYLDWTHRKIESLPLLTDGNIEDHEDASETNDDDDDDDAVVPDEDGPVYHIAKTCPCPWCHRFHFGTHHFLEKEHATALIHPA